MRLLISLAGISLFAVSLLPARAWAYGGGECPGGLCGTPNQTGGGPCVNGVCSGGGGAGCSILIAMTDRGDTYQFADDFDGDGIEDEFDNCAFSANFDQGDVDGDGVGDGCDRCPEDVDPAQPNLDGDATGDACDTDVDGDLVANTVDNCAAFSNPSQLDTDGDLQGNACDDDDDSDGVIDLEDACRLCPPGAASCSCDDDEDGDDVFGSLDNCPTVYNPMPQGDRDGDLLGDACDLDLDGDLVPNFRDNCAGVANPLQVDIDHDGMGDGGLFGTGQSSSCDPAECYVIAGDVDGCLNPNSAFQVRLALLTSDAEGLLRPGAPLTIALFSNRLDANHTWQASFEQLPRSSHASLVNAEGSGTTLDGFAQLASCLNRDEAGACVELNQVSFTPDAPGVYEVQVVVELPQGDPSGYGGSTAVATIQAEVTGGSASGCNAGATSGLSALALGLMLLGRRRRAA